MTHAIRYERLSDHVRPRPVSENAGMLGHDSHLPNRMQHVETRPDGGLNTIGEHILPGLRYPRNFHGQIDYYLTKRNDLATILHLHTITRNQSRRIPHSSATVRSTSSWLSSLI